jgi:endonuclease/exonuclease/phosphatase family metal-dependent hydrolase
MLWNVANNEARIPEIAAHIRAESPDIIGFAEAGNHFSNEARWKIEFPDHQIVRLPGQMLCLSRAPLEPNDQGSLGNGSWFGITTTIVNGRKVRLLQADINARPLRSRKTALRNLVEKMQSNGSNPLIVLGDFNTPRESQHLDAIRGTFQHAFETRGSGYAETWPIPVPVLSLDQVWLSKDFEILECEQGWTLRSDHRPVLVRLRLR